MNKIDDTAKGSVYDQPTMSSIKGSQQYYIMLAEESPYQDNEDSDDSMYDSFHGRETDVCRDTSDTDTDSSCATTDESITTMAVVEYEVASTSGSDIDDAGLSASSGDDEFMIAAVAKVIYDDSSSLVSDFSIFADTEDSDSTTDDPELGRADYWKCIKCQNQQNNPMYRYCEKCYQVRKSLFPPRPKKKRKTQEMINKHRHNSHHKQRDESEEVNTNSSSQEGTTISVDRGLLNGNLYGNCPTNRMNRRQTPYVRVTANSAGETSNSEFDDDVDDDLTSKVATNNNVNSTVRIGNDVVVNTVVTSSNSLDFLNKSPKLNMRKRKRSSTGGEDVGNNSNLKQRRLSTNNLENQDCIVNSMLIEKNGINLSMAKNACNNLIASNNSIKSNCSKSIKIINNHIDVTTSSTKLNINARGSSCSSSNECVIINSSEDDAERKANVNSKLLNCLVNSEKSSPSRKRKNSCDSLSESNPDEDPTHTRAAVAAKKMKDSGFSSSSSQESLTPTIELDVGFDPNMCDILKIDTKTDHRLQEDNCSQETYCSEAEEMISTENKNLYYQSSQESVYPASESASLKPYGSNLTQSSIASDISKGGTLAEDDTEAVVSSTTDVSDGETTHSIKTNSNSQDSGISSMIGGFMGNGNSSYGSSLKGLMSSQGSSSQQEGFEKCMMCLTEPKNGVFVHNRFLHLCCCYKCAIKVWSKLKRCPICNCKVKNVMKLFVH